MTVGRVSVGFAIATFMIASLVTTSTASGSIVKTSTQGALNNPALKKSFVLTPTGFGNIADFTTTTVAAVSKYLGHPTLRTTANCAADGFGNVPIVEWGDFALAGTDHNYLGYFYTPLGIEPLSKFQKRVQTGSIRPHLTTVNGVTLGTSVAKLKRDPSFTNFDPAGLGSLYEGNFALATSASNPVPSAISIITTSGAPNGQIVAIFVVDADGPPFCPLNK
ncbi:MAG TPA: hypothetical protein VHV57_04945 [Acidimicrobiales bacterium]|jgi:hypothetical protein|nr:hypothetical protein [Acidimicrobiales bacterium]